MKKKFKATVEFIFEAFNLEDNDNVNEKTITMYDNGFYPTHGNINFDVEFGKSEEAGGCMWDTFGGVSANMIKIEEVSDALDRA